jgi:hypothetical protein
MHKPSPEQWAAYDLAKIRLSMRLGEYSALIYQEEQKPVPDVLQVEAWQAEQDALTDQYQALAVSDFAPHPDQAAAPAAPTYQSAP